MDQKDKFRSEIFKTSNTKLIKKFEKIQPEEEPKEYKSNLKPLCIDDFNKMIDKSLKDSKHGNVNNARVLKEYVKEWKCFYIDMQK